MQRYFAKSTTTSHKQKKNKINKKKFHDLQGRYIRLTWNAEQVVLSVSKRYTCLQGFRLTVLLLKFKKNEVLKLEGFQIIL